MATSHSGHVLVEPASIMRTTADNKVTHFAMRDGVTHAVRRPLSKLTARIGPPIVRVHRSESVNIDAVVAIEVLDHADAGLTLEDGSSALLSRTHRAEVERFIAARARRV